MRRRSALLLPSVVLLGLLGTGLAVAALHRVDQDQAAKALDDRVQTVSQSVAAEIRRYGSATQDMAAAVGAQTSLEAAEFAAVTAPIDRIRLPGTTGVALVVPATTEQTPPTQALWRAHGAAGLVLQPKPRSDRHLYVVLARPLEGGPVSTGRDLSIVGAAATALDQARAAHAVTASHPYLLLKDAGLPADQQRPSLILAAPIYATSPPTQVGTFRGWIVLGIRGSAFLQQSIGVVARTSVSVTLTDTTDSNAPAVLANWQPAGAVTDPGKHRTVSVQAAQHQWQLRIAATNRLTGTNLHLQSLAIGIGTFITLLLTILTATVTSSRDRAERRVQEATSALRDDIARREKVEKRLLQREAELVGFAGVVAHDLRGPLARISGYIDFLREEARPHLDGEHQDFLDRVRAGATRMQLLLDDLLDYATADNRDLKISTVSLTDLVADIISDRTDTTTELAPLLIIGPLPFVDGDPTLLRQAFDNLIGNALKYTRFGHPPHIEITAQPEPDPDTDRAAWRIEISDHGIGIPAEQRAHVFTPFTRAGGSEGYPGTGLGLAIVHRIIQRHHGHIGIDSNDHGGSQFWITLPEIHQPAPQQQTATAAA